MSLKRAEQTKRVFVTGTDTDIGKTLAAGILARAWGAAYWKPIQAGTQPSTDSKTLANWIEPSRILPETFVLQHPASPNQAAAREGLVLDPRQLTLPATEGPLVVEGAGGLMVPINDDFLMIDLMVALALPVVLVARTGLGTLNHTLLSLQALKQARLDVLGIVLSGKEHVENRRDLEHFGQVPILGHIPPLDPINPQAFTTLYNSGRSLHD